MVKKLIKYCVPGIILAAIFTWQTAFAKEFTHFFISSKPNFYNSYKISGKITSVNTVEEGASQFNIVSVNVDEFSNDSEFKKPDTIDLKYQTSGFALELLPILIPGDRITYKVKCGFKCASGVIVSDSTGMKYIYDDGNYGTAFGENEIPPFKFTQEDADIRKNQDINPFYLIVSAKNQQLKLLPDENGIISFNNNDYKIHALSSYSKTSDATWTDDPYSGYSYIIKKIPH